MIGRTLGGYRIVEQIGIGGMAMVFKAYDAAMDRYVALKVLPEVYASDPTYVERFKREAKAIARLEHFHILPVYAFGEEGGTTYLVMRYLPTGTLTERLRQGPLPLAEAARILGQVADALDYAHRQGILHRDVKPSNILLDADGNAYLTDFGIAKIVQAAANLTGTGTFVGTPAYMSPEQCMVSSVDLTPATDIYSLGVVLYEMLTGRVPYQAETPLAVIRMKVMNEPLPPPRSLRPDLPEEVEAVILRALAHEPVHRYPSCTALTDAFERALAGMPTIKAPAETLVGPSASVESPTAPVALEPPYAAAPHPQAPRRGLPGWA